MMVGDGAGFHSGDWRDAFCARYERQAMTSAGVFGVHFSCRRKEFGLALSLARSHGPGSVFAPGLIGAGPSANSERFLEMDATGDHDARVGGHDRCAAAALDDVGRALAVRLRRSVHAVEWNRGEAVKRHAADLRAERSAPVC